MSVKWTKSQENAIFSRGKSLAVSAAAGSGKTSVLTQRILTLLSEGKVEADRLVVVTFTKAAAKSLSDKLYIALSDLVAENPGDKNLSRQLMALSRAQISTIHSFCYSLIRSYHKELSLPATLHIADPCRIKQMKEKAIMEGVEEFLSVEDKALLEKRKEICRLFGTARSLSPLYDTLFTLFEKASCLPGGIAFLSRRREILQEELLALEEGRISLARTRFGKPVLEEGKELFSRMKESFSALLSALSTSQIVGEKYGPFLEERCALMDKILSVLITGDLFSASLLLEEGFSTSLPRIMKCPPEEKELKEEVSEIHNALKKEALKFSRDHLKKTGKELVEEVRPALSLTEEFLALASLCLDRFDKAKREKGLLDYSDLENLTLKLVAEQKGEKWAKTPEGQRITEEFDAVFVDEYQDSNSIQDLIFRHITRPDNLFIVGDPKQSIYRFRGAEPSIFSDYKNHLPQYPSEKGEMQSIFLSHNFRSSRPIISTVNRIFTVMMDENAPDSLYKKEDQLRYGPAEEKAELRVSLCLLQKPEEEEKALSEAQKLLEEENIEAKYIASSIREMLSSYEPGDIAVICRTHRQISLVEKSLSLLNIPCSSAREGQMGENPEYLFVHSLLSALDNPTADVPLLATLLSPVFSFTSDDLYMIRKGKGEGNFYWALKLFAEKGDEKSRYALKVLKDLREESKNLSFTALIFHLYRTLSISALFSGGDTAVKDFFLSSASLFESMGEDSLSSFTEYLTRAAEENGGGDEEIAGVHLMTIHKSKGLEFPVVFVSFLGQPFDLRDEQGKLIFSSDLGCVFHTPALSGRARLNHFLRKGAKIGLHREMIEEEKRVLYVALTRAKEKLIMTANPRSYKTVKRELLLACPQPLSPALTRLLVQSAKSPLSLLLSSLRESEALRRVLCEGGSFGEKDLEVAMVTPFDVKPLAREKTAEENKMDLSAIFENLSFTYEEEALQTLPKKLSVSELLRYGREEEGDLIPHKLLDFEKGVLHSGAALIGTATHQVMQFADFENLKTQPEKEYARLLEKGFLTEEDLSLVEKEKIARFFTSPLYEKMISSPALFREKRFSVLLPADDILQKEGQVLVQGVIDAWFENEDGTLSVLDFKTDRVKEEGVLVERHRDQLLLYGKALEKLTGKAVRDIYLYSFSLGKEILVK